MSNLLSLLSQYNILTKTAEYLSTLDLLYLSLANSRFYAVILQSPPIFTRLKLTALCDGTGLIARQNFQGIYYALRPEDFVMGKGRKAHYDEELEVRVWNLKCDAANALPCLSCGINECRYVPRVRDAPLRRSSYRRPHNDPAMMSRNVICYCPACDESVEANLPLSLSKYCDCDQYTRWICLVCKIKEAKMNSLYYEKRTKGAWAWTQDLEDGRCLDEHVDRRAFWCPCGERPPRDGNVRCAWCKKRHNLDTWMDEDPNYIPAFDE
ncbi:hypothetical protein LCER1_G001025, partial [Lachnellula cervina]